MPHLDASSQTSPADGEEWPVSYRGVCLTIEPLSDGTYRGVVEGGFFSDPCPTLVAALEAATALIDQADQFHQ